MRKITREVIDEALHLMRVPYLLGACPDPDDPFWKAISFVQGPPADVKRYELTFAIRTEDLARGNGPDSWESMYSMHFRRVGDRAVNHVAVRVREELMKLPMSDASQGDAVWRIVANGATGASFVHFIHSNVLCVVGRVGDESAVRYWQDVDVPKLEVVNPLIQSQFDLWNEAVELGEHAPHDHPGKSVHLGVTLQSSVAVNPDLIAVVPAPHVATAVTHS